MDAFTHLVIGYLVGEGFFDAPALVALTAFAAVCPDFDTIVWLAPRLRPYLRHRGATHSLLAGVLLSLAAGVVFASQGWASFHLAALAAALGFASHVTLDVLNWGCHLLWPFRTDRVEFTVQRGLHWPAAASGATLLALPLTHYALPGMAETAETALGIAWAAYLLVRLAGKLQAHRAWGPGFRAYPTAHPLEWVMIDLARREPHAKHRAFQRGRTRRITPAGSVGHEAPTLRR